MARYRLNSGQHIQTDKTKEPTVVTDPVTGKTTEVYPKRTYKPGEVIETDTNLVARFGPTQYTLLGADECEPDPNYPPQTSVAPGGQVSTGLQVTSGGIPGVMSPEQQEKLVPKEGALEEHKPVVSRQPVPRHAPPEKMTHAEKPTVKSK